MNTNDITLFHRIVETGSLVEAANLVHLPKSTVSRKLKGLEDEIGVKLFHRQSRSMTLTSAGNHFYQKTLKIIADLNESIIEITEPETELSGNLKIQMFPIPDTAEVAQLIFEFMTLHPKLTVEIISTGEPLDMVKHNIDVAFRIEESFDELDMVVKPVITSELSYYASPTFLKREGSPKSPDELKDYNVVIYRFPNGAKFDELPLDNDNNRIKVEGSVVTNDLLIGRLAATCHKAIAFLPIAMCQKQVDAGELVPLFDQLDPYRGTCLLVYPSTRFVSLAAKRFIQYMSEKLTIDGEPKLSTWGGC